MTVRVFVTDLVVHGHHGVLPEEKRLGQRFHVDVSCEVDADDALVSDDVAGTLDYGDLCAIVLDVSGTTFRLIETLADRIAARILDRFHAVAEVRVTVRKPSVPLPYALAHAGAEVVRTRSAEVGFAFGSNVGDASANISRAVQGLAALPGVSLTALSHFYSTAPWGMENQPTFVNACALGTTRLSPHALLAALKSLEVALGRAPEARWGPRVIDVDILFFADRGIDSEVLTLPHRELAGRAFVLVPLAEIAPHRRIGDATVLELLGRVRRTDGDVDRI